jgi:ABC-2 type transport system permease protein
VVPSRADLTVMFEPGLLNGTTVAMHFVEERFARWPSHAFAAALFGLTTGQGSHPGRAFAWSAALPLLALAGAYGGGLALYRRLVARAAEGVLAARPDGPPRAARGGRTFPRWLGGPVGALLEKEVLTLLRSPEELGRVAFVAFLLLLYTVFFLRVPVPDRAGTEDVLARVVALSLLAAGYFLTTLALRFVFPAVSLEGRAVWILLASPVRLRALLGAKLALYGTAGFVALGGIALAGGVRLGLAPEGLALLGALLALMSVTIVAVALALGVVWPDFRGRTADQLATSGGGLLTTGICLAYVALVAGAGHRLVLAHLTGAPAGRVALPLLGCVVLSLAAAAGPALAARRRLAAFEAS